MHMHMLGSWRKWRITSLIVLLFTLAKTICTDLIRILAAILLPSAMVFYELHINSITFSFLTINFIYPIHVFSNFRLGFLCCLRTLPFVLSNVTFRCILLKLCSYERYGLLSYVDNYKNDFTAPNWVFEAPIRLSQNLRRNEIVSRVRVKKLGIVRSEGKKTCRFCHYPIISCYISLGR